MPERQPQDFRELLVWQRSHELALSIYRITEGFPRHEIFGLTSQMRRSAVSIPANIAEGCGRGSQAELARYTEIARGSASELEYPVYFARDLGYLEEAPAQQISERVDHVEKMLSRFKQRLLAEDALPYEWQTQPDGEP